MGRRVLAVCAVAALARAGSAACQPPVEPAEQANVSGNDILVTAQKRPERLQDVAASVSAVDGSELRDAEIVDLTRVAPRVPGLFGGSTGMGRPQLYIRGIGSRQTDAGSEASVGIFVDEVYLGRISAALTALRDIERVEVLKGPQSILYGRNTIAGAININSRQPTETFTAEVSAGLGSHDRFDAFGVVSGPLAGSGLRGRVAVWRGYERGAHSNLTTGHSALGTNNHGGRIIVAASPDEKLELSLTGEVSRDDGYSFAGESVGNIANPNAVFLARPGASPTRTPDRYSERINGDSFLERDLEALTLRTAYDLGLGTLTSITAYRHSRAVDDRDNDSTNLDVVRQGGDERSRQTTQELRFASEAGALGIAGLPVELVAGVYYYRDRSKRTENWVFGLDSIPGSVRGAVQHDAVFAAYRTRSLAGFAQLTLNMSPIFSVTGGARFTHERKRALYSATTTAPGLPLVTAAYDAAPPAQTYRSFDPSVTLAYRPSPFLSAYASYSRGFKSGGFQYIPFSASQANIVFKPERLDAYEIGLKASDREGRFAARAATFYYDYRNLQVQRVVPLAGGGAASVIDNAASSVIKGAELELSARPWPTGEFGLGYAYVDARYERYVSSATVDFSGTRMVRAPKHSLSLFAEQRAQLGSGELELRADFAWLSGLFFEVGEGRIAYGPTLPLTVQPSYGVLDLRAAYKLGAYKLTVALSNATDTFYRRSVFTLPGQVVFYPALPRTFRVNLAWSFH